MQDDEGSSRKRVKRQRFKLDGSLLRDIVGKYNSYPSMFGTLVIQTDGTGSYANGSGILEIKKLTQDSITANYRRRDIRDDDDCRGEVVFERSSEREWRGEWTGSAGGIGAWFITERRKRNPNSKMLVAPDDIGKRRSQRSIPRTNYSLSKNATQKKSYQNVFFARTEKKWIGQKVVDGVTIRVSDKNEKKCAQKLNTACAERGIEAPNPHLPKEVNYKKKEVKEEEPSRAIVPAESSSTVDTIPVQSNSMDPQFTSLALLLHQETGKLMVAMQKTLVEHIEKRRHEDMEHNRNERERNQEINKSEREKNQEINKHERERLKEEVEAKNKNEREKLKEEVEAKFEAKLEAKLEEERAKLALERHNAVAELEAKKRKLEANFEARISALEKQNEYKLIN